MDRFLNIIIAVMVALYVIGFLYVGFNWVSMYKPVKEIADINKMNEKVYSPTYKPIPLRNK